MATGFESTSLENHHSHTHTQAHNAKNGTESVKMLVKTKSPQNTHTHTHHIHWCIFSKLFSRWTECVCVCLCGCFCLFYARFFAVAVVVRVASEWVRLFLYPLRSFFGGNVLINIAFKCTSNNQGNAMSEREKWKKNSLQMKARDGNWTGGGLGNWVEVEDISKQKLWKQ